MQMDSRIAIKEKYRSQLMEQYAAAYRQLNKELNESQKPKIQENIEELEKDIEKVEAEIRALKSGLADGQQDRQSKQYREVFNSWDDNLHRIDFSKVNKGLGTVCDSLEVEAGAALFLLQNSHAMGGRWGVKSIKNRLQELGDWYPPLEFVFAQHQIIHQDDFLNEVAQRFNYSMSQSNEQKVITDLIEKIYGALRGGQVFLIQVEIPHLDANSTFLEWFVNQFWCPLVRQLPRAKQTAPLLKIFAVLTVRGAVHKTCLPEKMLCPKRQLDDEKIVNLPLQTWTETDIRNWLIRFSGLMSSDSGMTRLEIENIARTIHQVSNGRPIDVYHELMNTMTLKVS
jgi:hypothetical protein